MQDELKELLVKILNELQDRPSLPAKEFYSINEAAALTSLSAKHVRRAVVGGALIASDLGTKDHPLYRISRRNLLKWMEDREDGAKPPKKEKVAIPASRHHSPRKSAV